MNCHFNKLEEYRIPGDKGVQTNGMEMTIETVRVFLFYLFRSPINEAPCNLVNRGSSKKIA